MHRASDFSRIIYPISIVIAWAYVLFSLSWYVTFAKNGKLFGRNLWGLQSKYMAMYWDSEGLEKIPLCGVICTPPWPLVFSWHMQATAVALLLYFYLKLLKFKYCGLLIFAGVFFVHFLVIMSKLMEMKSWCARTTGFGGCDFCLCSLLETAIYLRR